jgi:hypothetical protein
MHRVAARSGPGEARARTRLGRRGRRATGRGGGPPRRMRRCGHAAAPGCVWLELLEEEPADTLPRHRPRSPTGPRRGHGPVRARADLGGRGRQPVRRHPPVHPRRRGPGGVDGAVGGRPGAGGGRQPVQIVASVHDLTTDAPLGEQVWFFDGDVPGSSPPPPRPPPRARAARAPGPACRARGCSRTWRRGLTWQATSGALPRVDLFANAFGFERPVQLREWYRPLLDALS